MWRGRHLMSRVSLLCAVTGGRSLPCRGLSSWKQPAPAPSAAVWIQTSGPGGGSSMLRLGKQLQRLGSRGATTAVTAAWREGSHVRSVITATAPEDVNHSQSQPRRELDEQQQESLLRQLPTGPTDAATTTARAREQLTATRIFRPDNTKRMLMIPEEEWPRYPKFSFDIESRCKEGTSARTGTLRTPHGDVKTPAFIFCATKAAIKGLSAETMKECGSQIILSNTYHLLVQPGGERIEKMGGLQKATRWEGPMLTDSGGYQIFSMGHGSVGDEIKGRRGVEGGAQYSPSLVSISEKGARFKSYHDCSIKSLTPERSIEIQRQLGADLVVVLDECTPFHVDKEYTASSMHRTHRWAMRSLREFIDGDDGAQALYGIIQGGVYPDLREEAAEFVNQTPFFGIAVGGSLGADKATMHQVVSHTMSKVRRDRPVHLLGIGGVADIFHGVRQGVDTFDCVHPTRLGRHGGALVKASFWEREREVDDEAERAAAAAEAEEAAAAAAVGSISQQNGSGVVATAAAAAAAVAAAAAASNTAAAEEGNGGAGGDISRIQQEGAAAAAAAAAAAMRAARRRRRKKTTGPRYKPAKRQRIVPREHVNLLKGRFEDDHRPIDENCGCPTCRGGYTRAYINHLGRAGELLGGMLVSQHNVFFMNELMTSIRRAVRDGSLEEEEEKWLAPGLRSWDFHRRAAEASPEDGTAGAAGEGNEENED